MAKEFFPKLESAINEHIVNAQTDIRDQMDAKKFVEWLRAELLVGKYRVDGISIKDVRFNRNTEFIGYFRRKGDEFGGKDKIFVLPEILGSKLLPAWQNTTNGTRTDKKSLLRQLGAIGYLLYNSREKKYTHVETIGSKSKRVYVFLGLYNGE
jgi:hypothetical protein